WVKIQRRKSCSFRVNATKSTSDNAQAECVWRPEETYTRSAVCWNGRRYSFNIDTPGRVPPHF
ncbi:hypothetical protein N0V84_003413, partial [Fusarium piperis]